MSFEDAGVIAITDCGSTTTKAVLLERGPDGWRQTFRGESPTTVEAPVEDVTVGVRAAFAELSLLSGRPLLDEAGGLIRPARDGAGVDLYLSTSSAGGGLQMMVAGVARRISAESAERAALGAGAIVADVVACDDPRPLHQQIDRLRRIRPDMVLLAGGVDGGADVRVVEMAELLAAADPRPRFGSGFRLPVIFAGNREARDAVSAALGGQLDLSVVDNIRPTVESENLGPARERIHDLFLDHVMRQAPGFSRLIDLTDAPVMPTPQGVGLMLEVTARSRGCNALCVDIGGATTDVFSVVDGVVTRTVSANLGMSYSATNVLTACGLDAVRRWLPSRCPAAELRDAVMNKTIRPTTLPETADELFLEQALAREALRLAFVQHRAFATGLKGAVGERNVDQLFRRGEDESRVRPRDLALLIGSGGVLSHAPRPAQTAAMMLDAFLPEGLCRLAKDSIFMMPHLGVLSTLLPGAATTVFDRDCLQELGPALCPTGGGSKVGRAAGSWRLARADGRSESGRLCAGDLVLVPLGVGEEGELTVELAGDFAMPDGARRFHGRVTGGLVGLILDLRGRPLAWPAEDRDLTARRWLAALGARDEGAAG